jgi:hypothetical protein
MLAKAAISGCSGSTTATCSGAIRTRSVGSSGRMAPLDIGASEPIAARMGYQQRIDHLAALVDIVGQRLAQRRRIDAGLPLAAIAHQNDIIARQIAAGRRSRSRVPHGVGHVIQAVEHAAQGIEGRTAAGRHHQQPVGGGYRACRRLAGGAPGVERQMQLVGTAVDDAQCLGGGLAQRQRHDDLLGHDGERRRALGVLCSGLDGAVGLTQADERGGLVGTALGQRRRRQQRQGRDERQRPGPG